MFKALKARHIILAFAAMAVLMVLAEPGRSNASSAPHRVILAMGR